MVSMFLAFISVMGDVADSSVNLDNACTYASRSNWAQRHEGLDEGLVCIDT